MTAQRHLGLRVSARAMATVSPARLVAVVGMACALVVGVAACEDDRASVPVGGRPGVVGDSGSTCTPQCTFKQCGDDGCGGVCGFCEGATVCQNYACVDPACEPACDGLGCGDDGCGGQCGFCGDGQSCEAGQCVGGPETDASGGGEGDAAGGDDAGPEPSEQDGDGDGVLDLVDNCPTVYNPQQADLNGDFEGDACDADLDGDGYLNELDCQPALPQVNPGAPELCGDNVDNDCNSITDEEGASDCEPYYVDADGDGAGVSETARCLCKPDGAHTVTLGGDCDDTSPAFAPLLPETCNGLDDNCNTLTDEGCDDDGDGFCDADLEVVGSPAVCPLGGGDCQDYWASVNPSATEVEGDGLDNDCDGVKAGEGSGGPIVPNCVGTCVGSSPAAFLCAMDICYPGYQTGGAFSSPTGDAITGAYDARSGYGSPSNDLVPFQGSSVAIMSSGYVDSVGHSDTLPGGSFLGTPDPVDPADDMNDAVEFTVTLTAPPGATGFAIDYIFMSMEYFEYVGTQFNDRFYIKMKAPVTTSNAWEVINYADCGPGISADAVIDGMPQCYIAINADFAEPCPGATSIEGTGYECSGGSSTGWLTTTWPVAPNETFQLLFHIHDTADEILDSAVVLDNFRWEGGTIDKGTASQN